MKTIPMFKFYMIFLNLTCYTQICLVFHLNIYFTSDQNFLHFLLLKLLHVSCAVSTSCCFHGGPAHKANLLPCRRAVYSSSSGSVWEFCNDLLSGFILWVREVQAGFVDFLIQASQSFKTRVVLQNVILFVDLFDPNRFPHIFHTICWNNIIVRL